MNKRHINYIQNCLNYKFKNIKLLIQAFIKENSSNQVVNYDVLEFYGDKILGFFSAKLLCSENSKLSSHENFLSALTSGELTDEFVKLTKNDFLAQRIEKMKFLPFLLNNKYQQINSVSKKTQGDLFEAILGAVAIDSCWNTEILEKVTDRMLFSDFEDTFCETDVLEYAEEYSLGQVDFYEEDGVEGKIFTVRLSSLYKEFSATAKRMKIARNEACKKTIDYLDFVLNRELPNELSSVEKLENLYRLKLIPNVNYYSFTKEKCNQEFWSTKCTIQGFDKSFLCTRRYFKTSKEYAAQKMLEFVLNTTPAKSVPRKEKKKKCRKEFELAKLSQKTEVNEDILISESELSVDYVSIIYDKANRKEIERPEFVFEDSETGVVCHVIFNEAEYKAVAPKRQMAKQKVCKMIIEELERIRELYYV